jgi:hypothetical protein
MFFLCLVEKIAILDLNCFSFVRSIESIISHTEVFVSFSASMESREDGSHGKLKDFILKMNLGFGVKLSDIFDLIESIDGASITIPGFSQGFQEPAEDIAMALGITFLFYFILFYFSCAILYLELIFLYI